MISNYDVLQFAALLPFCCILQIWSVTSTCCMLRISILPDCPVFKYFNNCLEHSLVVQNTYNHYAFKVCQIPFFLYTIHYKWLIHCLRNQANVCVMSQEPSFLSFTSLALLRHQFDAISRFLKRWNCQVIITKPLSVFFVLKHLRKIKAVKKYCMLQIK